MERCTKTRVMLEASLDLLRLLASDEATQSAIVQGECVVALVAVVQHGTQAETALALETLWWMAQNPATHEKIAGAGGVRALVELLLAASGEAEKAIAIDVLNKFAKSPNSRSAVIAVGGHEAAASLVVQHVDWIPRASGDKTAEGADTAVSSQPDSDEFVELAEETASAASAEDPE